MGDGQKDKIDLVGKLRGRRLAEGKSERPRHGSGQADKVAGHLMLIEIENRDLWCLIHRKYPGVGHPRHWMQPGEGQRSVNQRRFVKRVEGCEIRIAEL